MSQGVIHTIQIIACCARCEGEHEKVLARPFLRPPDRTYTHWATCPATQEPILVSVVDDVPGNEWVD